MIRRFFCVLILAVGLSATAAAPSFSQEKAADKEPAALKISAVHIEPAKPAADTLCRLRVEIENSDERIATQLGFTVTINGQRLPVYESHLFMFPLAPGGKSELPLYNFWSTETSRPEPANGKLEIEVTLREARWMKIATEGDTETWTPLGEVAGLPVSYSVTLTMDKSGG
jgi:hypothetical protein